MSWSLGETRGLAVKAARGAGMSWGLAEEAGFSVQWLEARGTPGLEALASYLVWRGDSSAPIESPSVVENRLFSSTSFCPIELGAAMLDSGMYLKESKNSICQPLLLVPFLASTGDNKSRRLSWPSTDILISVAGFQFDSDLSTLLIDLADCRIETVNDSIPVSAQVVRVPDSKRQHIDVLEQFAGLTYAPATEASRLGGAGAIIDDND